MNQEDKVKIARNLTLLTSKTVWNDQLEMSLLKNKVFSSTLLDPVKAETGIHRLEKLYDSVQKRGPAAFAGLVRSLLESGNNEAARILDCNAEIQMQQDELLRPRKVFQEPDYSRTNTPPPLSLPTNLEEPAVNFDPRTPLKVYVKRATKWKGSTAKFQAYNMSSRPRGLALIIDNEVFVNNIMPKREGSLIDANNLHILFSEIGFKVTLHRNLTYNNMMEIIGEFSRRSSDHSKADMCVVIILSHGDNGLVFASDGRQVSTEWVLRQFTNEACPALRGKPKFFILQACRGDEKAYGIVPSLDLSDISSSQQTDAWPVKGQDSSTSPTSPVKKDLLWEDMLIAYATIPGYVANRDLNRGTWFVESICKVFMEHSCDTDIRAMLDKVSEQMRNYETDEGTKQSCLSENRHFTKRLYFNTGLYHDEKELDEGMEKLDVEQQRPQKFFEDQLYHVSDTYLT